MKIDIAGIEGFDGMTAEQKVEALLGYDLDPAKAGFKTQEEFDKIMTENKQKKDEIRKLKEGAGANAELEKRLAELEERNKELDRQSRMANLKASFTELGYSKELAEEAAKASVENDTAKVIEIQSKFLVRRCAGRVAAGMMTGKRTRMLTLPRTSAKHRPRVQRQRLTPCRGICFDERIVLP